MKKDNKKQLFERMNKIGGMPLNEHELTPINIDSEYSEHDESSSYQVKLDNIMNCAKKLHDLIKDFDDLPSWVQDKITIAEHNMDAIHGWIESLAHKEDEMETDSLDESKNKPNNPELWSRAKSAAKKKFDVYPSAYANAWASKWYKEKGGTWRKK